MPVWDVIDSFVTIVVIVLLSLFSLVVSDCFGRRGSDLSERGMEQRAVVVWAGAMPAGKGKQSLGGRHIRQKQRFFDLRVRRWKNSTIFNSWENQWCLEGWGERQGGEGEAGGKSLEDLVLHDARVLDLQCMVDSKFH